MWWLLAAFVTAVVAFGRSRGLTALMGLAYTFTVIAAFVILSILDGRPPAVAIVGCAAIVLVVLYLTCVTTVRLRGTVESSGILVLSHVAEG